MTGSWVEIENQPSFIEIESLKYYPNNVSSITFKTSPK